jgi:hypothetical protein
MASMGMEHRVGGRIRGLHRVVLAGLAVFLLGLAGSAGARADDPKLAQTLMEAGKKALEEGDLDRAFANFQKASEEDDSLFEYQYWQAVVSEKRGDTPFAVSSYRMFLVNFDNVNKLGAPVPPATIPLAKKARARLEVLAAGPLEQDKLEERLVEKLMEAAKAAKTSSPEAARRAARWVLRITHGKHEAAAALLKELGDTPGKPGDEKGPESEAGQEPFLDVPTVVKSKSMLHHQVFGASAGWTWAKVNERWIATVDRPVDGGMSWPTPPILSGPRFVVEIEVRVLEEHKLDWAIGPVFGKRDDLVIVFFQRGQVVATRVNPSKQWVDIGGAGMPKALDLKEWQRLTYVLDGTALKVWFNGTKLLEKEVPYAADVVSGLGFWSQHCKIEVRTLRFGALP